MCKPQKCKDRECWLCRFFNDTDPLGNNCTHTFRRMYNIAVACRQYKEIDYYEPNYFFWLDPKHVQDNYADYLGHHLILLGKDGDIRSGTLIPAVQMPFFEYGTTIQLEYSRKSGHILQYSFNMLAGIIDLDYYGFKTHKHRVVGNPADGFTLKKYTIYF